MFISTSTKKRWPVVWLSCLLLLPLSWVVARPSAERYEPVSVKRQVEPNYPLWAYSNGVSRGFARVAFYVDEKGKATEFMPLEYTHAAFSEELLRVVPKWTFVPAHFEGRPIKSVCRAHWEFLPDRPVLKIVGVGAAFRDRRIDGHDAQAVMLSEESDLDRRMQMLDFPPVELWQGDSGLERELDSVTVRCNFFVDTEGAVGLPVVEASSNPELNDWVVEALKGSAFERPQRKGKPTVAWVRKTYKIPVLK